MNDPELLADASPSDRNHAILLQKYLEGTLADSELAEFEEMLKADKEQRALLVSICMQQALAPRIVRQENGKELSADSKELLAISSQPFATEEDEDKQPKATELARSKERTPSLRGMSPDAVATRVAKRGQEL